MPSQPIVEARSFDYIPDTARHGNVRGQFQFWFMTNATVITLYTGGVGPIYGLSLRWTLVALILGSLLGTMFQAFHGAQGPRMGLPQMIQSRVQFGSRGAILPLAAATFSALGFALFLTQTGAQAVQDVIGVGSSSLLQIVICVIAMAISIVGFNLVLGVERIASYVVLINLVALTIIAIRLLPISTMLGEGHFAPIAFLAQVGASAIYQLSIAPIVSDYTRYMPKRTSAAAISGTVFGGTMLSAVWLESLGAVLMIAYPKADVVASVYGLGNQFGFGLGAATMTIAAFACLITASIAMYSAAVALLSAAEAFHPIRSTAGLRAITITVGGFAVIIASLLMSSNILTDFAAFLAILGYFLIPWTAVNLIDYYYVRRGRFSITDIMRQDGGIYGLYSKSGLISYLVGFVAMIPFFSNSLYTGPIALALDKADVSYFVGLLVSILCYLFMMRNHDFAAELAHVRRAAINTLDDDQ